MDAIVISDLEVFAHHGVFPEENALGQKFMVSLRLEADLRPAGERDDLSASVDYGAVCRLADGFLRAHVFKLIETAAEGLASEILAQFPTVEAVEVQLKKPWAPIGLPLAYSGVEIRRERRR